MSRVYIHCNYECNNRQNGTFHPQLKDKLKHLKAHTDIPVVAGFGIRTKEHIKDLATVATGVVIAVKL